jgi:wyosine [tRNA(Phe)-imidazoG37] synthetase (radical SAM superfamily)
MSRNIPNDHPFNESEIQYLLDRGRKREVELNKELFPPGSEVVEQEDDSVTLELSQQVYEYVSSRTVSQLQTELRAAKLNSKGNETALRVRLAQHLQEKEDAAADA